MHAHEGVRDQPPSRRLYQAGWEILSSLGDSIIHEGIQQSGASEHEGEERDWEIQAGESRKEIGLDPHPGDRETRPRRGGWACHRLFWDTSFLRGCGLQTSRFFTSSRYGHFENPVIAQTFLSPNCSCLSATSRVLPVSGTLSGT